MTSPSPSCNESFAHTWRAEPLNQLPFVIPARQYVYPKFVEEVERGALFVYVTPPDAAPFLATFALGFAEPSVPHGIWSCPNPNQLCAVAGGYAYIIDITQPEVWQQIPYRPVTTLYVAAEQRLLLFSGFHSLFALGENGRAWETSRLSWEGLRITGLEADTLSGFGWDLMTDTEVLFTVDLLTGGHTGGAAPN